MLILWKFDFFQVLFWAYESPTGNNVRGGGGTSLQRARTLSAGRLPLYSSNCTTNSACFGGWNGACSPPPSQVCPLTGQIQSQPSKPSFYRETFILLRNLHFIAKTNNVWISGFWRFYFQANMQLFSIYTMSFCNAILPRDQPPYTSNSSSFTRSD